MTDLRYPIGTFTCDDEISVEQLQTWIREIEEIPVQMRLAVKGLDPAQLDTPYRPEGWTVRQVVHHLADGTMQSYTRYKLALTEEHPTIKPYEETLWAELPDSSLPVEPSLAVLDAVTQRWVALLRAMSPADFERKFDHPVYGTESLNRVTGKYSWHGRHHIAQITSLKERMGWS